MNKCHICKNDYREEELHKVNVWGDLFWDDQISQRKEGFVCSLCIFRAGNEHELEQLRRSYSQLQREFKALRDQYKIERDENTKHQQKVELKIATYERKFNPILKSSWLYIATLVFVVILTGLLVALGWSEKPGISVNYNVGEIIGGVLVGIGALVAGLSYSFNNNSRDRRE